MVPSMDNWESRALAAEAELAWLNARRVDLTEVVDVNGEFAERLLCHEWTVQGMGTDVREVLAGHVRDEASATLVTPVTE